MNCYLGIDGGGTKTAYLLTDKDGREMATLETDGSSYKEYSVDIVIDKIMSGIHKCLELAGIEKNELCGVAIGLPCFGESKTEDSLILEKMKVAFADIPFYLTNDVEVGWAGSLAMEQGINVVAGTGSICFGKNSENRSARSGGWSTFFGDEGSCYWIGRKTMELFSKQADSRIEKGALYLLVREHFNLIDDLDFIDLMEREYAPSRSKVASLQIILLEAARAGDASAIRLYECAAEELFALVQGVARQLQLEGKEFAISYSGGLFHAKEFVLPCLESKVKDIGGYLKEPMLTPVQGAALLARKIRKE